MWWLIPAVLIPCIAYTVFMVRAMSKSRRRDDAVDWDNVDWGRVFGEHWEDEP